MSPEFAAGGNGGAIMTTTDELYLRKREYYRKNEKGNILSNTRWDINEEILLLEKQNISDIDLAKKLGRSLRAVHVKRSALKRSDRKISRKDASGSDEMYFR